MVSGINEEFFLIADGKELIGVQRAGEQERSSGNQTPDCVLYAEDDL